MSQKKVKQQRRAELAREQQNLQQARAIMDAGRERLKYLNKPMFQYNLLMADILDNGEEREDRTGVGTLSICAPKPLVFDLKKGFPLVGIKETRYKKAFAEMLWFISGSTNVADLHKHNCHIWDAWADENGELGPVYGYQWRKTKVEGDADLPDLQGSMRTPHGKKEVYQSGYSTHYFIDQIAVLIDQLKTNPTSRRHLVSAWNVSELHKMALPPCHFAFQCYVTNNNELNLQLLMRSSDVFLGLPFNIAQYALLAHLIARECGYGVGKLTVLFTGDVHIYKNHIEQAKEVVTRMPPNLPRIKIADNGKSLFDIELSDITIEGYEHLGFVAGDVAV